MEAAVMARPLVECVQCGLVQSDKTMRRSKYPIEYAVTACAKCGGIWARYVNTP